MYLFVTFIYLVLGIMSAVSVFYFYVAYKHYTKHVDSRLKRFSYWD